LKQIIKAVIDAGASIKVIDRSYIDLTTPMGRERVRMGRKPKLTPHQKEEARRRVELMPVRRHKAGGALPRATSRRATSPSLRASLLSNSMVAPQPHFSLECSNLGIAKVLLRAEPGLSAAFSSAFPRDEARAGCRERSRFPRKD
jgi:hypothetical protein